MTKKESAAGAARVRGPRPRAPRETRRVARASAHAHEPASLARKLASRARKLASRARKSVARAFGSLIFALLAVAFIDEVVDGARQASWALVRSDLGLGYAQVGWLLTAPMLFGNAVEPAINLLADTRRRRALAFGGGLCFALACALTALGRGFWSLLFALAVFNPASGAFVNLSQATLMDAEPARREQNMARWVLAGSLGVVAGALAAGACVAAGLGWRACFAAIPLAAVPLALRVRRLGRRDERRVVEREHGREGDDQEYDDQEYDDQEGKDQECGDRVGGDRVGGDRERVAQVTFGESVRGAARALRRREVWRWLLLLELSTLLLDAFHGYLALYFTDVVGVRSERAGLAVAVWAVCGLAGESLLVPLLERVRGLVYLRASALVMLVLLPAFLCARGEWWKLSLVGAISLCGSGWYSILKAQLYAALDGRSGAALALANLTGFAGSLMPLALGLFAERFGLAPAMWLLALAPAALALSLPRGTSARAPC